MAQDGKTLFRIAQKTGSTAGLASVVGVALKAPEI